MYKTYKVVVRTVDGKTITTYVNSTSHADAQLHVEMNIKRAFLRITTFLVKNNNSNTGWLAL